MGMSASQVRLLSLTARMNDVEFKSQQLANTKMRLADESSQVADEYTRELNKTQIMTTDYSTGMAQTVSLNPSNLLNMGYALMKRNGDDAGDVTAKYANITSSELYEMIESGEFYIVGIENYVENENGEAKYDIPTTNNEISIASSTKLYLQSDSSVVAKAEANYTAEMNKINKKDKQLDNDIKKLDTEHNALKTEVDSVKNIISDNVEKSFNLFG